MVGVRLVGTQTISVSSSQHKAYMVKAELLEAQLSRLVSADDGVRIVEKPFRKIFETLRPLVENTHIFRRALDQEGSKERRGHLSMPHLKLAVNVGLPKQVKSLSVVYLYGNGTFVLPKVGL